MGKRRITQGERWQIIALIKEGTKSNREIARLIGVSEKCVRTTKQNFLHTGGASEETRPGRPLSTTRKDDSALFRAVRANPRISYKELTTEFNTTRNTSISQSTVRRILIKYKIGVYSALKKLRLRPYDKQRRLKWCRERRYWTIEQWKNIMWSDESNFELINRKSNIAVKRIAHEKYYARYISPTVQRGGGSIGIWSCFNYKSVGMCQTYTGRINSRIYVEVLENNLIPSIDLLMLNDKPWKLQQDGATAHTAYYTKEWFNDNNIKAIPWPPYSPDLNPIENICAGIDRELAKVQTSTLGQLKDVLKETWYRIPEAMCKNLVESMPRRVLSCIKAKGGYTKY